MTPLGYYYETISYPGKLKIRSKIVPPGVHGNHEIRLRILDAVRRTQHTSQQCQVQSICSGESQRFEEEKNCELD